MLFRSQKADGKEWALRFEEISEQVEARPQRNNVEAPRAAPQSKRQELLKLPFFKALSDVLGAQLMKSEEGFDPTAAPVQVMSAEAVIAVADPDDPIPQSAPEAEES